MNEQSLRPGMQRWKKDIQTPSSEFNVCGLHQNKDITLNKGTTVNFSVSGAPKTQVRTLGLVWGGRHFFLFRYKRLEIIFINT